MSRQKTEPGNPSGLKISRNTFIATVVLLLCIMILAGVLTRVIPQGSYQYIEQDGRQVIVPDSYTEVTDSQRLPVWRWFTAPGEVLATDQAVTAVMIMAFIMLIGGSFLVLEQGGILSHIMYSVIHRYEKRKYTLLAVMILICMLLGSTMGLFEETVTLVPITVALALVLGWDSLVGIGMSILAVGFGFAAGTLNPFTVGVAQRLAGLPAFSGLGFRVVLFVLVYLLLAGFMIRYAKKIEKTPQKSLMYAQDIRTRTHYQSVMDQTSGDDPAKKRAARIFVAALLLVFLYIVVAFFVDGMSDYAMPVMAVLFTAGALTAGRAGGLKKGLFKTFLKGVGSIAPSVLLILLAMSVTHIMRVGGILDTILHFFYLQIAHLGPLVGALVIFGLVLLFNFFIGGAAKAFLLIPIIVPLADMIHITRQTAVQAFVLGDGFTNMIYPTNVVLLIVLGMTGVSWGKWFRWTWKLQLALLVLSVGAMAVAVWTGYGP